MEILEVFAWGVPVTALIIWATWWVGKLSRNHSQYDSHFDRFKWGMSFLFLAVVALAISAAIGTLIVNMLPSR